MNNRNTEIRFEKNDLIMSEEEFYKEKIFNKIGIRKLKELYPNSIDNINKWYRSERYKYIQERKLFLSNKIKQIIEDGEDVSFSNHQMYMFFIWWENEKRICYYCNLPENLLTELHVLPGHINKRYPNRGKSLEIDRKQSNLAYTNLDNLVLACYWCNNAKTDTFTEKEFLEIGSVIKNIWKKRLGYKF
jgi:hypothetical protein